MIERLKRNRPKEVYFLVAILFFMLFLNPSEFSRYRIELTGFFEWNSSAIYQMIRGMGNDWLSRGSANIIYWVSALLFVGLPVIKARSISTWLWSEQIGS